jgi:hypothetical protein
MNDKFKFYYISYNKMIELILFNNVYSSSHDPNSPTLSPEQKDQMMQNARIASAMAVVIYIMILVLALYRAMLCSNANADSRAIHFLFATVSPVMYILLSYLVPGLAPKNIN